METYTINLFKNVFSMHIDSTVDVDYILNHIKTGNAYTQYVEEARLEFQTNGKSTKYNKLKQKNPVICFNALFKDGKRIEHITSTTGLVYIDFDFGMDQQKAIERKAQLVKNPYVYATWYSMSNCGIGCLVKADLNLTNFNEEYHNLCKELGFDDFDTQCATPNRMNFLSHDKDIYINKDSKKSISTGYSNINIILTKTNSTITSQDTFLDEELPLKINLPKPITAITLDFYPEMQYENERCVYLPEGKIFYEASWPYRNAVNGKRYAILSTYAHNLLILNPTCTLEIYRQWIAHKNKLMIEPLSDKEVNSIVDNKWKNKETLQPYKSRIKKFWTDPKGTQKRYSYLNAKRQVSRNKLIEKMEDYLAEALIDPSVIITQSLIKNKLKIHNDKAKELFEEYEEIINEYNMKKEPKSKVGIREFLESYEGSVKITQQLIADSIGVTILTVKRNITPEQKQFIKNYNLKLKK
jgi:hypothetical protein